MESNQNEQTAQNPYQYKSAQPTNIKKHLFYANVILKIISFCGDELHSALNMNNKDRK